MTQHWTDNHIEMQKTFTETPWVAYDEVGNLLGEYKTKDDARDALVVYVATHLDGTPSTPAWLRVIDEALIIRHLGVANIADDYETAISKLTQLLSWEVDVATDPRVNGGYELVPVVIDESQKE